MDESDKSNEGGVEDCTVTMLNKMITVKMTSRTIMFLATRRRKKRTRMAVSEGSVERHAGRMRR